MEQISHKFNVQPGFGNYPPHNEHGWEKERNLRISPFVASLVHHHPKDVVFIIKTMVEDAGGESRRLLVENIQTQMRNFLPGIFIAQLEKFKNLGQKERVKTYCCRFATTIDDMDQLYPIDLYRIIVSLINNNRFPKITRRRVSHIIQQTTAFQKGVRGGIRRASARGRREFHS